jgi:hypothetical protein
MSNFDELLRNNGRFAATGAKDRVPPIPFIPNKQVYILTCIDPRVDPAQVFGLELGDAIVARTVGGRVTPAVVQDLAWISYLHDSPWGQTCTLPDGHIGTFPASNRTSLAPSWLRDRRRRRFLLLSVSRVRGGVFRGCAGTGCRELGSGHKQPRRGPVTSAARAGHRARPARG